MTSDKFMKGAFEPGRHYKVGYGPRKVTYIRWQMFHRIQLETGLSLPEIGRLFGGYDHTSVLYGIQKVKEKLAIKEAA